MWSSRSCGISAKTVVSLQVQKLSRHCSSLTDNCFHLAIILAILSLLMVTLNHFFKSAASSLRGETLDIDSMTNLRYCRVRHDVVTAEIVPVLHHPHIASNFHPNVNYFTPNFKLKIWVQNGVKFFVLTRLF